VARLAHDSSLREHVGLAARARVEQQPYTWDGNAARVEQIAVECLAESRR